MIKPLEVSSEEFKNLKALENNCVEGFVNSLKPVDRKARIPIQSVGLFKVNLEGNISSFYPFIIVVNDIWEDTLNILSNKDNFGRADISVCKCLVSRYQLNILEVNIKDFFYNNNGLIETEWRTKTTGKVWYGKIILSSFEVKQEESLAKIIYSVKEISNGK